MPPIPGLLEGRAHEAGRRKAYMHLYFEAGAIYASKLGSWNHILHAKLGQPQARHSLPLHGIDGIVEEVSSAVLAGVCAPLPQCQLLPWRCCAVSTAAGGHPCMPLPRVGAAAPTL